MSRELHPGEIQGTCVLCVQLLARCQGSASKFAVEIFGDPNYPLGNSTWVAIADQLQAMQEGLLELVPAMAPWAGLGGGGVTYRLAEEE